MGAMYGLSAALHAVLLTIFGTAMLLVPEMWVVEGWYGLICYILAAVQFTVAYSHLTEDSKDD